MKVDNLNPVPLGEVSEWKSSTKLTVVTWNVYFDRFEREKRNLSLLAELEQLSPHLVCLQEVTPPFVRAVQQCSWLKEYWISATHHSQLGVLMLGRVPVQSLSFRQLSSQMGRRLLVAELNNGVRIASAHFESNRSSGETRLAQFSETTELLSRGPASLLCGDFNCAPDSPESAPLMEAQDLWTCLRPQDPGFTIDAEGNSMLGRQSSTARVRLDRMLTWGGVTPTEIRLLGQDEVAPGVWPSDHFGIAATVDIRP